MWRITFVLQAAMAARQIVFVRHGLSKMNVALGRQPWGSPNFVDPDIRDAPLEPSGLAGARALREPLARDAADVELVVSSPLTRALATADAAFDDALTRCHWHWLWQARGSPRAAAHVLWMLKNFISCISVRVRVL